MLNRIAGVLMVGLAFTALSSPAWSLITDRDSNSGSSAQAPAHISSPAIDIMNATFGVAASRSVCSVVKTVKTTCQGRLRCNVTASPSLCDPGQQDPGTLISTLTVIYRCSEREVKYRLAQVDRPLKAELSCADLLQ